MQNASLFVEMNYEAEFSDFDRYECDGTAALVFKVNADLNIEIEYTVDYVNIPPPEKERTDQSMATTVVIGF